MDKKLKEGVSVQELENFGKKYRCQIFLVLYFLLATLFTFIFFGAAWSVFLTGIGGILGVFVPDKIQTIKKATSQFLSKQENTTKLVLGVVGVIFALFLPPLIFFFIGLFSSLGMKHPTQDSCCRSHTAPEIEEDSMAEEEESSSNGDHIS